jgi:hypothetical protein
MNPTGKRTQQFIPLLVGGLSFFFGKPEIVLIGPTDFLLNQLYIFFFIAFTQIFHFF